MRRLATVLLLLFAGACSAPPPLPVDPALTGDVEEALRELGPGVRAGLWLSRPGAAPGYALAPEAPMPTASSIKAVFLVELFAARAGALDAPLPGADAVLADDRHPAIAHLPAAQQETARAALTGVTVRRLGEAMITGKGVDNVTYNVAANLVIACFGGPRTLQERLHARDPSWRGLFVRRYMLADRTVHGDNEATPASLAAVHGMLAGGALPGVEPSAVAAARAVLAAGADPAGRALFQKGGDLDSEPVTRVDAGFRQGPDGAVVYVVMLAQGGVPEPQRRVAGQQLGRAARAIAQRLLAAAP